MYRNNNIVKSGNIVKSEESRVVDSNAIIAERLQKLNEILMVEESGYEDEFYSDGFTEGLDAVQVDQLFADQDAVEPVPEVDTEAIRQMISDAEAEAEQIINAAKEEAEAIVASARQEAENIQYEAQQSGHEAGYQAGFEEASRRAEEAELKCEARERELEDFYSRKIDELEPVFVDKLTDIYEQVFKVDLSTRKELVLFLISDAMRGIEGGKNFLIHVSQDDFAYVSEHKEEVMQGISGTSTVEIIEDFTLSETQCFIEAESGIFDCGLGTELSLLKKELTLLSYRKD